MDVLNRFAVWVYTLGQYTELRKFIETDLLIITFALLCFGFVVLLIEIRLPLKYYWNLPIFAFKRLLQNFRILKRDPIWGTVKDEETNERISLTAVELVDNKSLKVVAATFSNRLGEFGFRVKPGSYFVRAVKNHYSMPSFLDPENIELIAIDESFAIPVEVKDNENPITHLHLLRLQTIAKDEIGRSLSHHIKTFLIMGSNGAISLAGSLASISWIFTFSYVYATLMGVALVILFIKMYIVETVGIATKKEDEK